MNKKRIILLGAMVFLLLILLGGMFLYQSMHQKQGPSVVNQNPFGTSTNVAPGQTTSPSTITIKTQNGGSIQVKDFIHNGETIPDVENDGFYVLAGSLGYCLGDGSCPSGASTTDFHISYDSNEQSFTVILLTEPLKDSRLLAEKFLSSRLGLSSSDLCKLVYYVGTPDSVNSSFSGSDLGFSMCTGATKLP